MIDTIYIERDVVEHPRARRIVSLYPDATRIICARYGEVFNRRAQSFRLQKRRPALILARKTENHVLEISPGYGMGAQLNFYFSHMLNCPHDCRYCYLRGAHLSAHYLVFVNYEDFAGAIEERVTEAAGQDSHFFSGFGCDSLALDSLSGFCDYFLPLFDRLDKAWLELRTKSASVKVLQERRPLARVVVAFSLSPGVIAASLERGAAVLEHRLQAMRGLAEQGWKLGLRFDPLIYYEQYQRDYARLFEQVFSFIRPAQVHSVSLGVMRFPVEVFARLVRLYPDEKLFAGPLHNNDGMVCYAEPIQDELVRFCRAGLREWIEEDRIFLCHCQPRS